MFTQNLIRAVIIRLFSYALHELIFFGLRKELAHATVISKVTLVIVHVINIVRQRILDTSDSEEED